MISPGQTKLKEQLAIDLSKPEAHCPVYLSTCSIEDWTILLLYYIATTDHLLRINIKYQYCI